MNRKIICGLALTVFTALAVHARPIYEEVYDVKNFRFRVYDDGAILLITGVLKGSGYVSEDSLIPPFNGRSVMIHGYTGKSKNIRIPPRIQNLPVTHIGPYAFMDKNITSVDIPHSVTYIGLNAFTRSGIESVTIPDSVTYIEHMAFSECMNLTSVIIPSSVTVLKNNAFRRCGRLASVVLPDSITSIETWTFLGCGLTSVTIPDSVTSIEAGAFEGNRLASLVIPDSVTVIETRAFAENKLAGITIGANVETASAFDSGFDDFYLGNGSKAGTYTFVDGKWEYLE
jgi:hypothetical protein